jgi:hypothetical protein
MRHDDRGPGPAPAGTDDTDGTIDLLARELARLDVAPARAEAIRARAHAELDRQRRLAQPGLRRTLRRAYRRVELGVVGIAALGYMSWTVQLVLSQYR